MYKFTDYEKEKLGKTFQYYRKKFDMKWDWIIQNSNISKNKYTKMSKGIILNKDEYYDEFLRIFNLKHCSTKMLEKWIGENLNDLVYALEYYDYEKITNLYLNFNQLEIYSQFPVYEQYWICMQHIFRYYYENKYLTENEIRFDMNMLKLNIFENPLVVYLLEVMYISNNNFIGSDEIRREIIKMINECDDLILRHSIALNEKCEKKLYRALELFEKLYVIWDEKGNNYRKTKALNGMFMIYQNIDIDKSLEIIPTLIKCKESNGIPKALQKSLNFNIGMFYFLNQKYDKAFDLFLENIREFKSKKELIFLGSICTHLSKELPDCYSEYDSFESPYNNFVKYYKLKSERKDSLSLVYYIMNTILKEELIHDEYYQPLWSIFEFEMLELLKDSKKNYNDYLKFREMMDRVCKYR